MRSELADHAPTYWKRRPIEDVCIRVTSGGTPSRRNGEFFENGKWPWVKTQELRDCWLDDTEEHITDDAIAKSSAKILPEQTLLLALYGATVGQLGILRRPMTCNQACCAMIVDPEQADFRYLYYALIESRRQLKSLASGAAQQNLSGKLMKEFVLPFPDLAIQHRIADILGKLDDKIELNRRMNQTLEKMAVATFKSWFIDFDPVHAKAEGRDPNLPAEIADLFPDSFEESELGAIPKGWVVKQLDEIADYLNGLACQKHLPVEGQKSLPVIKIRELRQGITNNTDRASVNVPPKYIVEDGDVLFSWSGSLLVSIWCGGRGVVNQHVFKVTSDSFPKWYFYQATKHHLDEFQRIASDKATTMGHIKRHHLTDAKMTIPGEELMAKGTEVLGTILDRRINALKQARILALTRDTLLPKLLNGELKVPVAEDVVEEVEP